MGTCYHVFLPPPNLQSGPSAQRVHELAPVTLLELSPPVDTQASSRHESVVRRPISILQSSYGSQLMETSRVDVIESSTKQHLNASREIGAGKGGDKSGTRRKIGDRQRARTSEDAVAAHVARRRLRTSASLNASRSQVDDSASLLSLNTTNSNPSQYPAATGDLSMANLPRWILPVSRLTTLQSLLGATRSRTLSDNHSTTCLICVMSVEPMKMLQRKAIGRRGQTGELCLAKWEVIGPPTTVGGKETGVVDVKLWDEAAREYGDKVKRGDVILLENATWKDPTASTKAELTLSNSGTLIPKVTVLYRTLPRYRYAAPLTDYRARRPDQKAGGERVVEPEDKLLRPDLRLERSDPSLKIVTDAARWLAVWLEGDGPTS